MTRARRSSLYRCARNAAGAALVVALTACGGTGEGDPVQVTVPAGAAFGHVAPDTRARERVAEAPREAAPQPTPERSMPNQTTR